MLMGRTDSLPKFNSQKELLIPERISEELITGDDESSSSHILYAASFDELAYNYLQYDTIIWFSISLLLVLAWGVGIIMLLYLPIKRYILQKDILSRRLYVTPTEIVYKVSRPSFVKFWTAVKIEKRVPLSLVLDIIVEQGCLQSLYGLHTIRIESISRGKAAPVDELQVQGVQSPGLLRKVIVTEAAKVIQDSGRTLRLATHAGEGEVIDRMTPMFEGTSLMRSPSKSFKLAASPRVTSVASGELLLNKLDEVSRSVKRIESLVERLQNPFTEEDN